MKYNTLALKVKTEKLLHVKSFMNCLPPSICGSGSANHFGFYVQVANIGNCMSEIKKIRSSMKILSVHTQLLITLIKSA